MTKWGTTPYPIAIDGERYVITRFLGPKRWTRRSIASLALLIVEALAVLTWFVISALLRTPVGPHIWCLTVAAVASIAVTWIQRQPRTYVAICEKEVQ